MLPTNVEISTSDLGKLLKRKRRKDAHHRLCEWGEERERIAAGGMSVMARIKLERDTGDTSPGWIDQERLTGIERQCETLGRVIQVENWVRAMPREWIVIVVGCYVDRQSQTAIAVHLGLERNRVLARLQDIHDRISAEIDAQRHIRTEQNSQLHLHANSV